MKATHTGPKLKPSKSSSKTKRVGSYEAKTYLPKLLAEVEDGARFTITRNGHAIALLSGATDSDHPRPAVADVIEQVRLARKGVHLDHLDFDELKRTGRR